jgi:hypothetical protein
MPDAMPGRAGVVKETGQAWTMPVQGRVELGAALLL